MSKDHTDVLSEIKMVSIVLNCPNCADSIKKPLDSTGCVTMINDHLYEGRFSPRVNGKRISKNVYAKTREECEEKLAEMIAEKKAEIAEEKAKRKEGAD